MMATDQNFIFVQDYLFTTNKEAVLLALYKRNVMYGQEIVRTIEASSNEQRSITVGSIYQLLHFFVKAGLIQPINDSALAKKTRGGERKYYKITNKGKRVVENICDFRDNLLNCKF